jgi:hypothetical protein
MGCGRGRSLATNVRAVRSSSAVGTVELLVVLIAVAALILFVVWWRRRGRRTSV